MRIASRVFCWLLVSAATVGCGGEKFNPNESTFPGAPGSSIPESPQAATRGGGMSTGDGSSLPSTYPGMEKFRAGGEAAETEKTATETEGVSADPAETPAIEPPPTDTGVSAPAAVENEGAAGVTEPVEKPAVTAEPAPVSEPAINP